MYKWGRRSIKKPPDYVGRLCAQNMILNDLGLNYLYLPCVNFVSKNLKNEHVCKLGVLSYAFFLSNQI